jgi:hypothetical protein
MIRLFPAAAVACVAVLLFLVVLPAMVLAGDASPAGNPALHVSRARSLPQVTQEKTWNFERFDTDIKVNTDGSLSVRETQVANFTGSFHFLNRDLTSSKANFTVGRTYGQVRFRDIKVYDLNGQPYGTWKVENIKGGKRVRIAFSAFNEQKGWIIQYRMTGALIYAPDYDRLYFNTVSSDRAVPIKSSRATVLLPRGTDMAKVRTKSYADPANPPSELTSGRVGDTLWWESKDIAPYTALTVDVAFPPGLVSVPLAFTAWFGVLMIALAAIIALVISGWIILLWRKKGRDIGAPESNVVQYEPPGDLKPAEVGVLINETPVTSDITATIVDLAIRGKLVISERESGSLLKHKLFGFDRKDPGVEDLADYERKVMEGIFESGDSVTEDDLKDKFYKQVGDINSSLKELVLGKGFFDGDPTKVRASYYRISLLLLLIIVPVVLLWRWYDLGYFIALAFGLGVAGVVVLIIGRFMPRRTAKGSQAYSYVAGFKEYMSTAEREEMKFMTPENFQANLPYAMVLGVADKWAGKFRDIYTSPPDWYHGYYPGTFSTVYLAESLSRMQTSVGSTLVSSPSSSSGGGGGFGGGSSGGGFGGGGSSAG